MSPLLFIVSLAASLRRAQIEPIQISSKVEIASKEFADDVARITPTIDAAQKTIINISKAAAPATLFISGPKTKFVKISKKKIEPTTEADLESMCLPVECDLCGRTFPKPASLRGHLNLKWCPNAPGCRLPPLRTVYLVRSHIPAQNKRKMLYDGQERNVKANVQSPEKRKRNTNTTSNMNKKWRLLSTADGRYYVPSRRNQLIITVKEAEALYLDDRPIEQVYQFCYLGAELTADGDEKPEIIKTMDKAMQAFNVIKFVLTDRTLAAKLRFSLLCAYVGSVLLYASETSFDFEFAISRRLNVFSGRI